MSNLVRDYLISQKYNTASDETYSHIDEWLEWYQGDVEKFHRYKIFNGSTTVRSTRYRLNMAKKVCEDWANLLLNEKVAIKAGRFTKRLNKILESNNFLVRANQLIEIAYALGTGAFVEYLDENGNVIIDYIKANSIYPLSWDNGDITECAFGTQKVIGGREVVYIQIHRLGKYEGEDPGEYYIENRYIDVEAGKELEAQEDTLECVPTKSKRPLFQIITPNIYNNVDIDSPLGISVYANAIYQLKGCDLVYDSFMNEFTLGRKRILVPISAAKRQMAEDGVTMPVFDADDTVFYQMPADRQSDLTLTEVDMSIRAAEHEIGIQKSLDILSFMCGLGNGRYKFENGGVKTATEVISDKSELYQNRQKNAIVINTAIVNMVAAVSFLDTGKEAEATVDFDDSIIEDSNTTIDRNLKLVQGGLRSRITAIMEINKCSESEAQEELERIAGDNQITGKEIDWTEDEDREGEDPEEEETEEEAETGEDVEDGSSGESEGGGDD